MFTLFYHHRVREITVLYSNKWKEMENEKENCDRDSDFNKQWCCTMVINFL